MLLSADLMAHMSRYKSKHAHNQFVKEMQLYLWLLNMNIDPITGSSSILKELERMEQCGLCHLKNSLRNLLKIKMGKTLESSIWFNCTRQGIEYVKKRYEKYIRNDFKRIIEENAE